MQMTMELNRYFHFYSPKELDVQIETMPPLTEDK